MFQKFLRKNSINDTNHLPIVHSSEAYLIKKAIQNGLLKTSNCEVFDGEELLYFFVGRPAYKKSSKEESEYWELPSCILFDFTIKGLKRVFPFDSGAFFHKKYPRYINMMDLNDYSADCTENGIKKIIGAFFRTSQDYYRLNPIEESKFIDIHSVDITDEEIISLHRLIKDKSKRADDRRFSVEMQFSESFDLKDKKPIYCIVPENYMKSDIFVKWCKKYKLDVDTYPVYPLRRQYYYATIYEKIDNFYRLNKYYEV